ncbi:MAG: hypothetical protein LBR20_04540 [Propionibacteriaceae bacterium]|jgi:hypothetical protein|nr:hypothetical protein [Propionibacteriaceae bacterium]
MGTWVPQRSSGPIEFASPAVVVPESNEVLLDRLHESSGLTWEQIAKMFNVSRRSIHLWLAGGRMSEANRSLLVNLAYAVSHLRGSTPEERRAELLQPTETGRSLFDETRYRRASNEHDINRHVEPVVSEA